MSPDLLASRSSRTATRLVGRARVLDAVHHALDEGRCVVLSGPSGMGKSALLDAVAESRRDELVLRAAGVQAERWISGSVLTDLLAQVPPDRRVGHDRHLEGAGPDDLGARGRAWHELLAACAAHGPVLLLLDDVQLVDPTSSDVLAFAVRRLAPAGVRVVTTWRW